MNSKYLDSKKLNLNTFISQAPPSLSEQKIHGFSFSKSSLLCESFVIFFQPIGYFGYKLLSFYLLLASQLFKVPIGHCHYLNFNLATRSPCPYREPNWRLFCFSAAASFLQVKACATKEEQ
jgi:hypothetical protein